MKMKLGYDNFPIPTSVNGNN